MPSRHHLSDHRLARIETSVRLWLLRLANCLEAWAQAQGALDLVASVIARLVIMRAAAQARTRPKRPAHVAPMPERGDMRAVIGSDLRRALRGRSVGVRITALLSALRDLDAHAAKLLRRLPRGITRRQPILPKRADAPRLRDLCAASAFAADTS